ncbi:MAG: carboxypeptidase-like regulatory domain-containing protein, partial [Candidatus Sulfotelmatobacter sp.]
MQRLAARSLGCLGLLLSLLVVAWAGVGGSISGTVKDPSGAAIANASVTLINSATSVRQSATADGRGSYTFPVLPVGNYVLEVNQPGFKP